MTQGRKPDSDSISTNPKQRQWRHHLPSAPLPLAATEVLCSDSSHRHLFQWVKAPYKWQKNMVRRGWFDLYNLRSLLFLSCTNHCYPLAPPRPWRRRMRFASTELITSHRNGSQPVLNSARIGKGGTNWSWNTTINLWRQRNNLPFSAQARRRRKEEARVLFFVLRR